MLRKLKKIFWDDLVTFGIVLTLIDILFGAFIFLPIYNIIKYIFAFTIIISVLLFLIRLYRQNSALPLVEKFLSAKGNERNVNEIKEHTPKTERDKICLAIIFRSISKDDYPEKLKDILSVFKLSNTDNLKLFLKEIGSKILNEQKIEDYLLEEIHFQLSEKENNKIQENIIQLINHNCHKFIRIGLIKISSIWYPPGIENLLINILKGRKDTQIILEMAIESIAKLNPKIALQLFQDIYNTCEFKSRLKMLEAAENILHSGQSFFQHAALCQISDLTTRKKALELLVREPHNKSNARACLCKILLDDQEKPVIRQKAAQCLKELDDDAENELLKYCEDEKIDVEYRIDGVISLNRGGLSGLNEIKNRLNSLYKKTDDKLFKNEIQKTIKDLSNQRKKQ